MSENGTQPLVVLEDRCTVPGCSHTYKHYPLDAIPIIGNRQRNLEILADTIATHIRKKHPELFNAGAGMAMNFQRFLALRTSDSAQQDKEVAGYMFATAAILRAMVRLPLSNEDIGETVENVLRKVAAKDYTQSEIDKLVHVLKPGLSEMSRRQRDYLTQDGEFAPPMDQKPAVVA